MPRTPEIESFPDALMLNDGSFTTAQGNLVLTNYVDLSGALPLSGFTLAKASEPRFDLRRTGTIRLSRPGVFRSIGLALVKDDQEGRVRTETRNSVEEPDGQAELDRRIRALRAGLRLCRAKMSVNATAKAKRSDTASANVTFGRDWLMYSTSVSPGPKEEDAWRRSLPDSYTSIVHIHRPTQFAQALGFAICEHVGANGKPSPTSGAFFGFKTVEVERISQLVIHGPVLYVADPYQCIEEADEGWALICSMIFVKSRKYAAQKEYRFTAMSIRPDVGKVVDLPLSGMMRDCLEPVNGPVATAAGQVLMAEDATATPRKRETSSEYTYRRRVVKRQTGNWGKDQESKGQEKEEIVEETVTSPEELPGPLPSEQKQPDVIVFHQVGDRYRFQHHAYRKEETERWRIVTLRENPEIAESPRVGGLPNGLDVPEDVRFDSVEKDPLHPELILDICLNPSIPKPPLEFSPLGRFSALEVGHAMACNRSLGMAVDLFTGVEHERAAASAWCAFQFVLDLVGRFGAIVKSLCVIQECVAVVELERAPFSGAVAWATFSGCDTYTLYVDRGDAEELILPGRLSRAGRMSKSTFVEALRENGWALRTAVQK